MRTDNPTEQDIRREELQDRLTEQQLREAFNAETPPDLTSQILAAADRPADSDTTAPKPTRVATAPASARSSWRDLAIAACLLVLIGGGICLVVASSYQAQRQPTVTQAPASPVLHGHFENVPSPQLQLVDDDATEFDEKLVADKTVAVDDVAADAPTTISGNSIDAKTISGLMKMTGSYDEAQAQRLARQSPKEQLTGQSQAIVSAQTELANKSQEYRKELDAKRSVITAAQNDVLKQREKYEQESAALTTQIRPKRQELELFVTPAVVNQSQGDNIHEALKAIDQRYNQHLSDLEKAHQAQGEVQRNAQRQQQLIDELTKAKTVLEASDLNIDAPAISVVPKIDGSILRVAQAQDQIYVEVSAGSDDGLQQGHEMEVYRGGTWLGRGTIVRTTPDRAVAIINRTTLRGEIKERDRIETRRSLQTDEGTGPDDPGDQYSRIVENEFLSATDRPLSTFSIDVDTASYSNVRQFLLHGRQLPPPDAVRIEELVNYFDYNYAGPKDDTPFASHMEVASCPWEPKHRLLRIALKGKEVDYHDRPNSNLVFLIDVSGSMQDSNKLPLCVAGMKLLASELNENDRVAIVVYANSEGLVLPSTPGARKDEIIAALDRLQAGGSTNGGAGIKLAYQVAQDNFVKDGINRVILCTDGDFNVGTTSTAELERMAEQKAKSGVFLTVLGFGRGNLNDAMMETISNKGNGNYAYIDGLTEAKKVLIEQMSGTLMTIAKDVKIQVEFNPAEVYAYRLIGYENRVMAAEDFNDDLKDAGEIGAGHTVTALYEIVPHPQKDEQPTAETGDIDALKYQRPAGLSKAAATGELLTLKLRYKQPDGDKSRLLQFPLKDDGKKFGQASDDFKFASSVAAFGMLLRSSKYAGNTTIDAVLEIAQSSQGPDKHGYRAEFVEMARKVKRLGK